MKMEGIELCPPLVIAQGGNSRKTRKIDIRRNESKNRAEL